ncbi:MAG TPA: [protein-PII] uridylyltransferase [Anaeromyxobacteraceae bacterium]|nr:[protein-PII] uridylyltransferase [Anaeromyxobacteraceae bacterium]
MLVQDNSFVRLPKAAPYEYEAKLQELPGLTGDVRVDYAALRGFVEAVHKAGGSGHTVVRLQSAAMDRIVSALWDRAVATAAARSAETKVALVALGGYGRRELAPYSDVDLLVLHAKRDPGPFVKEASERFLYSLWDLKLEVGYGVRDIRGCEQLASEDHTARTALLDLRYLRGDQALFRDLERDQLHGLSQARVDAFIAEKMRETRERRERFGDSLYLLEPNLKQSEGGLRDLASGLWAARAKFKVAGITELLAKALLPEPEVVELRRARDFVWRVRNQLHYATGRKTDQLTFDLQPQVAAFMGYGEGDASVEEFMRHYYLAAKTILVASDAIVDRCLEPARGKPWRRADAPASRTGAEGGSGPSPDARPLPGGEFKVFRGRLTVTDRETLRKSPAALVRLFATADREGLDLYPYARDMAAQAAVELAPEAASDPELNQELLAMFTRAGTRGRFLTLMHDLGALGRILPEFARVTARRQIDLYHVYTVDVHSLFAARRLFALRTGDLAVDTLSPLMQKLERPLGLYLGTLFHDIGKGSGKDHSVRGAEIAAAACVRMGIDPADGSDIEWLVLKHLRMANLAQRRDLSDPDLIHSFAEEVGTLDRLDKLYLLTYADIATVGPRTWTEWKGRLLKELYEKTRSLLEAGAERSRPIPGTHEAQGRAAVVEALAARHVPQGERERFVAAMPSRYFLTEPPSLAPRHLRLLQLGRRHAVAAVVRHRPALGFSDLALTAVDRPGLLAVVAGVLAAHKIDIQHAEVFSTPPDPAGLGWLAGRALDLFELRGPEGGALDVVRWRAARVDLTRVLEGEVALEELMARRLRVSPLPQKPLPRLATKVVIDNDSSREHSVIDVFTADRVGLLHTLSRTFFDLGLSVDLARITTEGHRAADAFYVRTASGGRIEGPDRQRVEEAVAHALTRN